MNTKYNDEILAAEAIAHNNKDMPLSWAVQYLRAYLNRTDLAIVLATQGRDDFDLQIEKVRNSISLGQYEDARNNLLSLTTENSNQSGEHSIEMARVLHYSGDYVGCINLCDKTIATVNLNPVSKMTLMQIRGVSNIQVQNFEDSIKDLMSVANHATLFPYSKAIACAIAYLVWIHSHLNNQDLASKYLLQLQHHLELIASNQAVWISRLLFFIRAQFHFENRFGDSTRSNNLLIDSLFLAQWLTDCETAKKAKLEIYNRNLQVVFYEKWHWIESQKIVLWRGTTAFKNLATSPLLCRITEVLRTGPQTFSSLFEHAWGLKYKDRNEKTLRSTLSKLRKAFPENALIVKDSIVYFN